MYVKEVTVENQVGLHARPATFFIQKANEFKSSIWVEKEERRVTVKTNGHIKFKPASPKKEQHIQSNRSQKTIDNAHILGTIHLWGMCALPQQRSNCQRK